jgi:hypothetical protein
LERAAGKTTVNNGGLSKNRPRLIAYALPYKLVLAFTNTIFDQ